MAQSKLNDLAGRFSKGPKGLGTGLKLLALAGAAGYGITQSMYTGKCYISYLFLLKNALTIIRKCSGRWSSCNHLQSAWRSER